MDVVQFHYYFSVFYTKNAKFNKWFNAEVSWKNKYIDGLEEKGRIKIKGTSINFPVQLTDAWHFFKMLMIIFICMTIVFYKPFISPPVDILFLGVIFNVTFSLCYNKLFKK